MRVNLTLRTDEGPSYLRSSTSVSLGHSRHNTFRVLKCGVKEYDVYYFLYHSNLS